jgi:hypothetical protein
MEDEYVLIYLNYENSNDSNYQFNESIPNIVSNRSLPEMIISEFTNNRDKYLLFEPITNQVSYALNPAINEAESITYEKGINESKSTVWKYAMQEEFNSLTKNQI